MIGYLQGTLLAAHDKGLVLLTPGGVGYEVAAPTSVLARLPGRGGEVSLFVHTQVGEKAIDLFGFLESDDLDLFRTLISIDKLGPKKALAILSMFDAEHLREVAYREDATTLSTVPGIGPKSAKQILWHLKDKVNKLSPAPSRGSAKVEGPRGEYLDTLAGLKGLGYSEDEVRPMILEIFDAEPDLDAAGAIRATLRKIAAARS
ncbi:MAG: Holliday junction branch migration protein RuvA [Pseudodesulfovibrio sp.]|uniref:Holliday junction branch migration complex subunit RuvA n=1 Tax=Pseudodesulfovibrio aespoeensis (strain ATCC 700646 / DSM 10631 / Aspo-2) TaxID=643562 RepID=E6VW54_PSEA9|nr:MULTISPECIES: Holliday junction branch migration protein RuvA [Pseudodesulfovibrio]MBU4191665.1 Holliday junction branch migration protein RuvA [Pseudomonadota bacterium]ADU63614.1 Holliday junction DNA helicase RuvA [Pseudodesulfovibrio aespoeensis Aspo-2]MBU4243229.1 Holliday junction branch migration protein RuvA [Pseudomonadota bacterium]MBU4379961.1 Holliday junction branch migration protein RuvA [Pseudomonadota bacterium]MBU4475498.1 Holliday junction branch migration protein RuvA [Ps